MKVTIVAVSAFLAFGLAALAQEIAGIGLDIVQRKNANEPLRTRAVHPGSPAEKAGIKPDGFLISVDGTNVVSMSLTQAVKMVRGPVGTSVTVQLADFNMTQTNTFTIKRSRMVIVDNKMQFFDH
jgi:carboxyl-terminal processing protease